MEPVYTPVIGFARALFAAEGLRFTVTGAEHILGPRRRRLTRRGRRHTARRAQQQFEAQTLLKSAQA